MNNGKEINIELDKKNEDLMNFITETKEGKYTNVKPKITDIVYKQIDIELYNQIDPCGNNFNNQIVLLGISN